MGLLQAEKDADSHYRSFDADSVSKAIAIRYLRNMGCTLEEVERLLSPLSYSQYCKFFDDLKERQHQALQEQLLLYEITCQQSETIHNLSRELCSCHLLTDQSFYFLDYMKDENSFPFAEEEESLLHSWVSKAMFTKNYSPFFYEGLYGSGKESLVMGLAISADYAYRLNIDLSSPVYFRHIPLCLQTRIHHFRDNQLKSGSLEHVFRFLEKNQLIVTEQPFLIADCTYFSENGQPEFFSQLYIPVAFSNIHP